ncbi:ribonuclease E inhibitor RraB [Xinfangfangia pollutisoli]|uniref:ribonuclease E inhibitor RraB n=1 Tax=Xinfangfangia pollutisoli TaxID=2865960 RepID=UPI001CD2A0F6|nr:ribonuclease E inhibitor RraB [Xinfangfangia pollutisoli]
MTHDYARQRRETFDTFRQSRGVKLPERAVVDFEFFVEENDSDWAGFERALRAKGFRCKRMKDGETLLASIGPIPVTAEEIWHWEELATGLALKFDFYPDGWELDL